MVAQSHINHYNKSLRVLAGGILNFSGTLLGELIFLAQGDVLGILVHFWGS